ncbi:chemotaxis protein CheW [Clostridia bacterium]|nr:chemotaxis protein CheW [Clostridia bacterium]GHU77422.1 chemotaxis protein CheW [Clostridia bacterium]
MAAESEHVTQNQSIEEITKDQYLTFIIDDEEYAIGIAYIQEIVNNLSITVVPQTPDYVKGIVSLRGDIIPAIDVRCRFHKPEKEFDEQTCIVFVEYQGYQLGLIVDKVKEVMFIEEDFIAPPPSAKLSYYNQFVKSIGQVGDEIRLLLDLDKFLLQD